MTVLQKFKQTAMFDLATQKYLVKYVCKIFIICQLSSKCRQCRVYSLRTRLQYEHRLVVVATYHQEKVILIKLSGPE